MPSQRAPLFLAPKEFGTIFLLILQLCFHTFIKTNAHKSHTMVAMEMCDHCCMIRQTMAYLSDGVYFR